MNLKKDKIEAINSACSIDKIDPNKFISKNEAFYKVKTQLLKVGNDKEAAFLVNLESLQHMIDRIKIFNEKVPEKAAIKGIRVWKGTQDTKTATCLEDLVFVPVDNLGNYVDCPDVPVPGQETKPVIMAATRPCPHLCGTATGQKRFFTGMDLPMDENPYLSCLISLADNTTTQD